ncbi:hypothetical protein CcI156_01870 [Frankia sp. CcI156]|nr:hypothetical protein CcI156_01870 [Frankia sp. CcI156]
MGRHHPDSDRIRGRVAAAVDAPLSSTIIRPLGPIGPVGPSGPLSANGPLRPLGSIGSGTRTGDGRIITRQHRLGRTVAKTPSSRRRRSSRSTSPDRLPRSHHWPRSRRRSVARRGTITGALLAIMSITALTALALLGPSGSNSPAPPTTTVTAKPRPSATLVTTSPVVRTPVTSPQATAAVPPEPARSSPAGTSGVSAAVPDATSDASAARRSAGPDPADPGSASGGGGAPSPSAGPSTGPSANHGDSRSSLPGGTFAGLGGGIYTSTVAPFPSGSRVRLPGPGTLDWVLFGGSWDGVQNRAAIVMPLIDTGTLLGTSVPSSSGFDWTEGTPVATGVDDTDRLSLQGSARLTVFVSQSPLTLDVLLGSGSGRVQIIVTSIGGTQTFTQTLPSPIADGSADGVVSIGLPAGIGTTSVTISSGGTSGWTLAAAVLR